jgi:hypothetical protein
MLQMQPEELGGIGDQKKKEYEIRNAFNSL